MPDKFRVKIPNPPPLAPGESWVTHLNLYVQAFFAQQKIDDLAAGWRADHPLCPAS